PQPGPGYAVGHALRAELPLLRGADDAELHAQLLHRRREGAHEEARLPEGAPLAGVEDEHRRPHHPRAGQVVRELPRHPGSGEVRGGLPVDPPADQSLIPHSRPTLDETDAERVAAVVRRGWVAPGPEATAFERELAARLGTETAAAVSSGSAALELALRALGVGPGDEVVIPTYVCDALYHAVVRTGATPVLADADRLTLSLSADDARARLTSRTRCLIVPHAFGMAADLRAL